MALPSVLARVGASLGTFRTLKGLNKINPGKSPLAGIKMDIKVDATKARNKFEAMYEIPLDIIQAGYDTFKKVTPYNSGNAYRNTRLDERELEIQANYPYAERLDKGWSKQAPQGMVKPSQKEMKRTSKKIVDEINRR